MVVQTADQVFNDSIKSEASGKRSREKVTVLAGSGADRVIPIGSIIGKRIKNSVAQSVVSGTGNGTMDAVTLGSKAKPGVYTIRCVEAAMNAGIFEAIDPDGLVIGRINVGAAFVSDHLNTTVNDGTVDYIVGDSFTVTVSGDGKVVQLQPARAAIGFIQYSGQPIATETITVNGKALTYVAAAPGVDDILIGADLTETLLNTEAALNAHADTGIDDATYKSNGFDKIDITHDTPGTGGNAFTLAESGANTTVSGATLTGGLGSSTDGTQEAFGILGEGVTAPDGVDVESFAIVRDAVISEGGIVWAVGVLDVEKAIALAELEKKGIASRSAA